MSKARKHLMTVLKFVLPLALIVWLVASVDAAQWRELATRPKQWDLLFAAFALVFIAVCLTFVRWYLLVRSLQMKFSMWDAFRLGFLGYLFNFVSAGSAGGDLFKAFFIAREQPGRRAEAVATVIVDRVIGLYALLLVASAAILCGDVKNATPAYQAIRQMTLGATVVGAIGIAVAMTPGFTRGRFSRWLARLPRIGGACERLLLAVRMYGDRWLLMTVIFGMSMFVHGLLAVSLFLIARSLFGDCPPLVDHLIIVPLSMVAGALPFTPSGLGSFEFAMDELYKVVSGGPGQAATGILVALVYRLMTIAIAAVGVVYYWTSKARLSTVLAESNAEEQMVARTRDSADESDSPFPVLSPDKPLTS